MLERALQTIEELRALLTDLARESGSKIKKVIYCSISDKDILTSAEMEAYSGMSDNTLKALRSAGLPCYKMGEAKNASVFYNKNKFIKFMDDNFEVIE